MFRDRLASDLRIAAALDAADGAPKKRKRDALDVDVPSSGYSHGATVPSTSTIEKIAQRVALGATVDVAAASIGISGSTLRAWYKKGEKGEEPFLSLLRSCVQARAKFEVDLLTRMSVASSGMRDPKTKKPIAKDYDMGATMWLLHRRCGYGVPEAEKDDAQQIERPAVRIVIEEAPNVDAGDSSQGPADGPADPSASGSPAR